MSYINSIDTPNKAYILGFVYGSGSIYKDCLTVCGPKQILKDIAREINHSGKIVRAGNSNKIHVYGWKDDLSTYGLGRKSNGYIFPAFNLVYLNHFVRGIFDAKGVYNYKRPQVSITLWHEFGQSLRDELDSRDIEMKHYMRYSHVNTTNLFITKKDTFNRFMRFIYLNSELYEESKFSRYEAYLNNGV